MNSSKSFRGIGASPGVAIGRVFLLDRERVYVPRYHIGEQQTDAEAQRLRQAIDASIEQLEGIRSRFVGDGMDHQAILEAHEMMLRDQAILDETVALIREELINAEWAVHRVVARVRQLFDRVSDAYMRERGGDIDFVGERILRNLTGQEVNLNEQLSQLKGDTVVVAHDLSPADTALLTRHKICAFVTEVGGKTSHTSIVARSIGVPAVVGVPGIFGAAGTDDHIVVDGLEGSVMLRPSRAHLERGRKRSEHFRRVSLDLLEAKSLPARTLDGFDVTVAGNIELPAEVPTVMERGGEAIGLYRTEFMFLGRRQAPDEEEHYRTYCELLKQVDGRPVTIRTLDLGGEKTIGPVPPSLEPNPALGLRAIRYCLQNRDIFEPQIAGLLRAATRGPLRIMLPMISGLEELRAAHEIIADVERRLTREGKEHAKHVTTGIMIEVPSAVLTADVLAQHADFFAVGTNDLLQYLLAIDRTNERVAYLYHPLHPAVLRTLQMISHAAQKSGIPLSLCGEMAGEAEHTSILVGLGFSQLSMNSSSIPRIKRLIRELSRDDCVDLLHNALQCHDCTEVEKLVRGFQEAKVNIPPMAAEDSAVIPKRET